jgi:hypothetical protein
MSTINHPSKSNPRVVRLGGDPMLSAFHEMLDTLRAFALRGDLSFVDVMERAERALSTVQGRPLANAPLPLQRSDRLESSKQTTK